MTLCPDDPRLSQLLEELLEEHEAVAVLAHIETCTTCQERLEALTRGQTSRIQQCAALAGPIVLESTEDSAVADPLATQDYQTDDKPSVENGAARVDRPGVAGY